MFKTLAIGLAVLSLGLGGTGFFYREKSLKLGADLVAARAVAEGLRRTTLALQTHIQEVEAEREHWRLVATELEVVEGADEPLNPYERAVLDRVRGSRP